MTNTYVFNKIDPHCYTMDVYPATQNVAEYLKNPDYTVCFTTDGALYFLDLWGDRFEPQARAEYRAFLEQVKEAEAEESRPEAEQAAPVLTPQAAAVMCDGLKAAAGHALFDLLRKTPDNPKTSAELLATVERLESYRLALSALAAAWSGAERAAKED